MQKIMIIEDEQNATRYRGENPIITLSGGRLGRQVQLAVQCLNK